MHWCFTSQNECTGLNGATDAEMDMAMALLVATKQWPSELQWNDELDVFLTNIMTHEFIEHEGIVLQKPGDTWGGASCTNPSYYAPGYYRCFSQFVASRGKQNEADFWLRAIDGAYYTLSCNAHPQTGLFWAWCDMHGKPANKKGRVEGGGLPDDYQYDACRTPWRLAVDYLWCGSKDAEQHLKRITNFVFAPQPDQGGWFGAGGPENIVDGYLTMV